MRIIGYIYSIFWNYKVNAVTVKFKILVQEIKLVNPFHKDNLNFELLLHYSINYAFYHVACNFLQLYNFIRIEII